MKLQARLIFFAPEIHKGDFAPLFYSDVSAESKEVFRRGLVARYRHLDRHLADDAYMVGSGFTLAYAYLLTVSEWAPRVSSDLAPYPLCVALSGRLWNARRFRAAMRAEGPESGPCV